MVRDIGLKKLIPGKKDRRAVAAEWTPHGTAGTSSSQIWERRWEEGYLAQSDWEEKHKKMPYRALVLLYSL
jgi:hypothetical protein